MSFTVEQFPDRDNWLARRRFGIAASESAALFKASPFLSEWTLYQQKIGALPEDFDNERLYWGRRLEPIIVEEVTIRKGWQLVDYGRFAVCQSKQQPFMLASLDRIMLHPERGPGSLDGKNSSAFMRNDWNEEGVLLYIQVQMQHQLAVTGYDWGAVAVLLGGSEWRLIEFERDQDFIDLLVEKCADFWGRVQRREEPPVDAHPSTTEGLKSLYTTSNDESVILPPEALEWDRKIELAQQQQKDAAEVEELHKNMLRRAIGPASFGVLPDQSARWSFRPTKGSERKTLKKMQMPKMPKKRAA